MTEYVPVVVTLLVHTPYPDDVCDMAAATCVSREAPKGASEDHRSLRAALRSGHLSVCEHASFTFMVENVTRVTTHQLVRHRLATFCVAGTTKIRTNSQRTNNRTIAEIYRMKPQYFDMMTIRCVDEKSHDIKYNKPIEVIYTGVKPTYTLTTIHGYSIRATAQHMFLSEEGWKRLEDLKPGDKVYINGINSYKDKDWLKMQYHDLGKSQEEIGIMCGVTKNCIRAWVRKFGLQKEPGSWCIGKEPPNKGRTKENYEPLRRTSEKCKGRRYDSMFRSGPDKIGSWVPNTTRSSTLRARTHRYMGQFKKNICEYCGFEGTTELHHLNKDLSKYDTDIVELCVSCHKAVHRHEITQRIVLSEITSIEYYGDEETYDIHMPEPYHNYIADGFVVHNSQQSQRYVALENIPFIQPDTMTDAFEKDLEARGLMREWCQTTQRLANRLREDGVPEEDIRYVYPGGTVSNIMVTMNGRELLHFLALRRCTRAQWEIRYIADRMAVLAREVAPVMFERCGPTCEQTGRCPEARSCGRLKG